MRLVKYYWGRTRRNKLAVVGLIYIVFLVLLALVGPFFTPDPTLANFDQTNLPPLGFSTQETVYDIQHGTFTTTQMQGIWKHPLGTDSKGRDLLAMLVSGARISLWVGIIATGIAIIIGTMIGIAAAYFGRWVDTVLMRFTDIMMTFPFFLLLVFIVFIFGPSLLLIVIVIGLTGWTGISRLIRSETLSLRTRDFIIASKALGGSDGWIMLRHLVPNVASLIIVMATLSIPGVILAEAALSFIGLGDPTIPSWGVVLQSGQQSLDTAWWVAVEPGIMLLLTTLAFNFLGDGLRDAFDPKSKVMD
jgi:peptide/nickel transport system permease protein